MEYDVLIRMFLFVGLLLTGVYIGIRYALVQHYKKRKQREQSDK